MNINYKHHFTILSWLLLAFCVSAWAQNPSGSNIVSRTKLEARGSRVIEQRVYDNGLGDVTREAQSFPGTSLPDIIVQHEYDEYRRKTKTWLPVTSASGGSYVSDNAVALMAESQYADTTPYSLTEYDGFLLSQTSSQYKAGSEWQSNDRKTSVVYRDTVMVDIFWQYGNIGIEDNIKFFCTRSVDEDGCPKAEYTDITGRLKISETSQGKTYYVYNDKGDIEYVLPPAVSEFIIDSNLGNSWNDEDVDDMIQKYAYIYHYDYKRHCIYKKLPGCAPIYYIYDRAGNCILTQDGNQRQRGEWAYAIPDRFGRPCLSGICHNDMPDYASLPLSSVHVYANYTGCSVETGGYAIENLALDSQTLSSAMYYDGYSFIGQHGVPSSLGYMELSMYSRDSTICHGMQTGSATAYFDENGVAGYTYSAIYYDSRYNVAQVVATNHLGYTDVTSTKYSYTGKPQNIKILHGGIANGHEENYSYSYDNADRLSEVTHKLDTSSNYETLLHNTYNGLGQLTSASNGIFTTDYEYDMHSWLRRINVYNQNPLFEERLMYADSSSPCYNGNISAMTWKNSSNSVQRYNFAYDDASRLTSAAYSEGNNNNKYGTQYAYDCMGNITSLRRNGLQDGGTYGLIDDLTFSYDGNRLTSVNDAVTDPTYNNAWNFKDGADSDFEYEYDENGNLTKDLNKNISSIQYNSLNLPTQILFADGNVIRYTYSADGRKLRAVYTTAMPATTKTIDYCGNLIFENGTLKQILVDGGYIMMDDWSHPYCFYIKDHLGNNRMVVNQRGTVDQVNNYYPYGGLMANSTGWNAQRYKYNGKEFDRMHGLDWYDYGARWQDAAIGGRWHAMDPLCEKYYDVSPYVYCKGDPINLFDPDGSKVLNSKGQNIYYINKQGQLCISNYATKNEQLVYKGLMLTATGQKQLRAMINSRVFIHLQFKDKCKDDKGKHVTYAETQQYKKGNNNGIYMDSKGKFRIKEATIYFYMNSIKESLSNYNNDNYGLTFTEAIGAEAAHESVHASDPIEIHKDIAANNTKNGKKRSIEESEKKPNDVERKYRQELKEKNENEN